VFSVRYELKPKKQFTVLKGKLTKDTVLCEVRADTEETVHGIEVTTNK
jgi:hypothetical protein